LARYKNIELEEHLLGVIPHMNAAEEYREMLQHLQAVWDNLALLGQLSGAAADMSSTRLSFESLSNILINQLAGENLRRTTTEMQSKAQVIIDMLTRNLFERTADIGFFATDEDIRQFLQRGSDPAELATLRERLAAYVEKYSVYRDVVLFNPAGQIVARLDDTCTLSQSGSAIIAEALQSTAAYTEVFGRFDFLPNVDADLVYSCKVTDQQGNALGVLCLCFKFADEMTRIYQNLAQAGDRSVAVLIDDAGSVIASSNPYHMAIGIPLTAALEEGRELLDWAGVDYLVAAKLSQGFQGYMGPPGWRGVVLIPVQYGFNKSMARQIAQTPAAILDVVMESDTLFNDVLRSIPDKAERIQHDLNRTVWNGSVIPHEGNQNFSKILMMEIIKTGARTKDVFERSINNLHETIVSSYLHASQFLATQAIDIMDRNLYERANDCRWWALTSAFRASLDQSELDTRPIQVILQYINGLYTVYTNLVVFDPRGCVIAVSNAAQEHLVGSTLTEEWVARALRTANPQQYAVSDFVPTPLYDDQPTYIYAAGIRSAQDNVIVGGIGIVFDAAPQFAGILRDILPRTDAGELLSGSFAIMVDEGGKVIACSDEHMAPGSRLPDVILALDHDDGAAAHIACLDGNYYAVGRRRSFGYREFKGPADAYANVVDAYVFLQLCEAGEQAVHEGVEAMVIRSDRAKDQLTTEIASFRVGESWYGLPSAQIVEAIEPKNVTAIPGSNAVFAGYVTFRGAPLALFDICRGRDQRLDVRHVIVLRLSGSAEMFGVLASELGTIADVAHSRQSRLPVSFSWGQDVMTDYVIEANPPTDKRMLQVLSVERLAQWIKLAPTLAAENTVSG
jgi:chemotaxis signal transduction protein